MTYQSTESSQPSTPASTPLQLTIVGIAGANGSRQALESLFHNLPEDSGMAFVVVARMGRKQVNQLPAQLQQQTTMPVLTAADGIPFQPDHIYIVPAGTQATFRNGQLHLQDLASSAQKPPQGEPPKTGQKRKDTQGILDTFLRSLANEYGAATVAILLSGNGTDGLVGLQRVQEVEGFILIQDPHDAAHGTLLRRALARMEISNAAEDRAGREQTDEEKDKADNAAGDTADYIIGSTAELARQLIQRRGALRVDAEVHVNDNREQFDQVYQDILTEIDQQTGHDLSHYKISTLSRRIARRMQMAGIPSPTQYVNYLKSHENEAVALFKDSLVSVTSFFRDTNAYTMLERDCIPQLFAGKRRSDYIRVWVAGCATGEEAYSVAMQLMDHASQLKEPPRFQVFATDLDEDAIAFARQGLYPATVAKDMSPTRFERFFTEENGSYRINTDIREHLLFAVHNLLKDPPFSRLDLICCRNVLIYFNREAQEKVFDILHYALNSNGYLFLGSSESVDSAPELFSVVDKYCHLYQRRDVVNTPQRRLPTATPTLQGRRTIEDKRSETAAPVRTVEEIYTAWSLRTHTPARLLINDNYDITHMFGEVSRFLQDRDGANSQNILDRVRPELRLDLQTALYPAFQKGERTISRLLNLEIGEITHLIQVHVGPVNEPGFPDNVIEVVFVVQDSAPMFSLTTTGENEHVDLALMTRMEEELMRTRERMQTVVEEYEDFSQELKTSNEELQSINEELKSTTEELETSKEELQSMNEELVTLNGELNHKIDELNRANSDLMNFIASTDVGAIFLDQQLCLSRFTPRASELFNLIESDIRRPLAHITHRIRHTALADLAAHVRETADHIEETVQSADNHWYILRLFPYRTVENQIDGVVITFVDISDLKRAESEERQRRQQQVLAELSRQALIGSELDALLQTTTEQVAQVLGMALCKILEFRPDKQSLLLRAGVGWQTGLVGQAVIPTDRGSQAGYTLQAQGPVVVRDLQTETRFQGPSLLTDHGVRSGISVTIYGSDGPYGVLGVHDREPRSFATYDVDFLQAVANTIAAAVTRRENMAQLQFQANILAQINDAVITVDNEQQITYLNSAAAHQYATDPTRAIGQPLSTLHTYRWLTPQAETDASDALAGEGNWRGENVHIRHDGAEIPVESTVSVLTNHDESVGMLAVIRDMTAQKVAEAALRHSEARLQLATTVAGLAIIEIDYATDTMHVSAEAAILFGIAAEETTVPRSVIHATFHPEDEAELWQQINACLDPAGSGEFAMEHRVVWPDGTVHWLSVRKRVFFSYPADREAHPVRALLVAIDVTERKQAEDALRRSEERYRYLFETMDEGFCVVEILVDEAGNPTDYHFLEANPAFAAFTGLENPIGRTARELVPGLEDHWVEVYANVALTGKAVRFEQGSAAMGRWFNVYVFPVGEAEQRRVAILFNNITERKRMEDALRVSEAEARRNADELEAIYNTAPVGLCVMDQELRYVRINERLAEINGIPAADHIGRTGRELLPDLAGKTEEALQHILVSGEAMIGVELTGEIPSQPGVQHTWIESWLPLHNQAGEVVAINIVVEDITERKQAERDQQFLLDLDAQIRPQEGVDTILATAAARIGEHLQVAHCIFKELDLEADQGIALTHWRHSDELSTMTNVHQISTAMGMDMATMLATGQSVTINDTLHDSRTASMTEYYRALGIQSMLRVPFNLKGSLVAVLTVADEQPRHWRPDELALLETVLARVWPLVVKARAEQALRASEAEARRNADELEAIYNTAPVGLCVMDRELRWVRINERLAAMNGYPAADHIGKTIRKLLPHLADEVEPILLRILETGEAVLNVEINGETPAQPGVQRTWVESWFPIYEQSGQIIGINIVAEEITERKQAEEDLRRSEEQFRAVQQTTPDGFMIFESIRDEDGTIVDFRWLYTNPAAEAMLGRAHAELVGKQMLVEMPGNREDGLFDAYVRVVETGEVWQQEFHYQHEGLDHWFRTTAAKTGDGFAVAFADITANKQAEAALRASEERFRSAFEQAAVGMAHLDPDGSYLRVNDRLCEILGYTREELLQKTFMEITHPADLEADMAQTKRQLAGEIAHHSMEKRYIRKDGSSFWANMTASVVRDEAGEVKYGIVVIEDITARRAAEAALREFNATLEERIAERTAELERSNEDLDQFAYVASHDLKAPLRGIDSLASWITEDADAVLPDESKGHLARLRSRVQRMEQLLEDLLTYSRVGRRDGGAEQVEVGSLVHDMVELLATPAGFTITVEGEMPTIRTPRAPLELVFRNLIGNAVKHHEEPEHGEIRISARDQGEFIEFRIADNGPGIDAVHHERIFTMFQTLRPRDQVEGSGMGLAIVQRIVELRGGTIRVESILGDGATFIFTWPKES